MDRQIDSHNRFASAENLTNAGTILLEPTPDVFSLMKKPHLEFLNVQKKSSDRGNFLNKKSEILRFDQMLMVLDS